MQNPVESFRYLLVASIVTYFVYDLIDRRRVRDEREDLIQLKALSAASQYQFYALCLCAFLYWMNPEINALWPILGLTIFSLYSEMGLKIYFRKKI